MGKDFDMKSGDVMTGIALTLILVVSLFVGAIAAGLLIVLGVGLVIAMVRAIHHRIVVKPMLDAIVDEQRELLKDPVYKAAMDDRLIADMQAQQRISGRK